MSARPPMPTEIRRVGVDGVRITWADGHRSDYRNDYLRQHCPCAECRARPTRALPVLNARRDDLYAVQIGVVGRYAVSVQWSDGHDTGIYSYETLRALCPCGACRPGAAAAGGPAS
jgi:DUF971 family protein